MLWQQVYQMEYEEQEKSRSQPATHKVKPEKLNADGLKAKLKGRQNLNRH